MKDRRTPKAGEKFYSERLEADGFFPEWATKEYVQEQRRKYPTIHIPDYIVDFDVSFYEPEGYDLEDLIYNSKKQRWEEKVH